MPRQFSTIQKCAFGFAALFLGVYLLDYVPGIMDQNGLMFGLFHMTMIVDIGHLALGSMALIAALSSAGIAGNSRITISVLAPQSWHYDRPDAQLLFSAPILTRPEWKRDVLGCDVALLSAVVKTLRSEGIGIEHIYDY
jgi:hypothetical protein